MPYFFMEYSANLKDEADADALLTKVADAIMSFEGVFPTAAIRARAIAVEEFAVADSQADYAYVHARLKIRPGRPEAVVKATCEKVFEVMKAHFAALSERRYLALSLELELFDPERLWVSNNIQARFAKAS